MRTERDAELHGEGWRRLLAAARRKLERTGGELTGSVGLAEPTDAERRVIIGITGRYRGPDVRRLTVPLAELDSALREAGGPGLAETLEATDGPLRNRPAERAAEVRARTDALAAAQRCEHAGTTWYAAWLDTLSRDGTLTRLVRRGEGRLLGLAAAVLDLLPAADLPLPVLAERATGDTKALAGTPLAGLVLRALALREGVSPPSSVERGRMLWDAAGVVVDDLASQVLVLNLPADGDPLGAWLSDAAALGMPFRVTLHQLTASPVRPRASVVYVCENPAVLRAAATELGSRCAPLVCTEGVASVACRRLLRAAAAAGARIRWRNDFDWPGLRMTAAAIEDLGATAWRMAAEDYRTALHGTHALPDEGDIDPDLADAWDIHREETGRTAGPLTGPLTGPAAASPWDERLAKDMTRAHRTVMEERLIPVLLTDLTQALP